LTRARLAGVPALELPRLAGETRQNYDARLAESLAPYKPDWIILAGWMRVLTNTFLLAYPNRVVNLHPALPGTFPGINAIERAFQAYRSGEAAETGVMVHYVPDEGIDCGPVICQERVPIYPEDRLEDLEQRIHQVEHRLLIKAIAAVLQYEIPILPEIETP
jgi:phosphoribosylglycinamide formyltransferase-1